jgi:hypothetical protein
MFGLYVKVGKVENNNKYHCITAPTSTPLSESFFEENLLLYIVPKDEP